MAHMFSTVLGEPSRCSEAGSASGGQSPLGLVFPEPPRSTTWQPQQWTPSPLGEQQINKVSSLAVCGERVAVGHESGAIVLHTAETGAVDAMLLGHKSYVNALVLLPGKELPRIEPPHIEEPRIEEPRSEGPASPLRLLAGGDNKTPTKPPDKLVSCSTDHSVRVWDMSEGCSGTHVCEAKLEGHTGPVCALALLQHERPRLASGSHDRTVRLWDESMEDDVSTWKCTAVLVHATWVIALAALPDGGFAGCMDGCIALWSVADRSLTESGKRAAVLVCKCTATLATAEGFGHVWSLAVLSDGRIAAGHGNPQPPPLVGAKAADTALAAVPHDPNVICVWDTQRRACDLVITGHTKTVRALVAVPYGRLLSASGDNTVKVWDERVLAMRGAVTADAVSATLTGHTSDVVALAVLSDCRVVSGGFDGAVRCWR